MSEHDVPPQVEHSLPGLKDMRLSTSLFDRFVADWKRHRVRNSILLAIAVTLPLWRYVWIPSAVSSGLSTLAESYGAELEVGDWSSDWGNIRVVGEDVVLHARGAYTNQRLLEANAIELDWSLWRGARGLFNRFRSLVLFRDPPMEEPVHAIKLRRATLHMERLLSGRWNWHDAIAADRVNLNGVTRFRIPAVDAEQLRLVWVEHLPGNSGGGLIEQTTASMFLDDVRLRFTDVVLPQDTRPNATSFSIDGRTADGRFSITGNTNVARWNTGATSATRAWSPTFDVSLYLENVGAAALTRMVSDASLLPSSGTMTGRIQLVVDANGALNCKFDLQLRNVQYAPNPRSRYIQAQQSQVERELSSLIINQRIVRECSANWQEPDFRLAKALQAEITGEAVQGASPIVQGAAGYDRLRFVAADESAVDNFTSEMSAKIGAAIGGQRGAAVAQALTSSESQTGASGNVVTRGVKSVGRGIKRLFGGGGDKKKK